MIVDILALVVLLISAAIAFLRGFIREILTILGTVGALTAAYFGGPMLSPMVKEWLGVVEDEQPEKLFGVLPYTVLGDILAYGSIFIVVIITLSIISHFLAETAKSMGLGAVDRTLGVIFGFVRGLILLGLLYLPVHLMVPQEAKTEWFEGSKAHFYVEKTAELMANFLPESTVEDIEEKVEDGAASTREKLENMNILQKEGAQPIEDEKKNAPGYTEEFRDEMDQLFEEKTDNERKLNE